MSPRSEEFMEARERGDYDAAPPSPEEAADFLAGATEFVAAVERLLGSSA